MKKLLHLLAIVMCLTSVACSTLGRMDGAGVYKDSVLANPNPAPARLTPPDFTQNSKAPVMDDAYLTSQADYHFTMGETYSYEGQSAGAIEEYKTTLVYDPKSIHVRLRLATEYVRMGMITEAVEQSEIAVEMAPNQVPPHMLLGGLYSGLKMYEPARKQFLEVLRIEPGHTEASIYTGALLAEQKHYDDAIKYFEALTKNKAFDEPEKAFFYLGRIRTEQAIEQGQKGSPAAEQAFKKALQIKPEYPEAAMALASNYRAQGKDKAMEQLLKSYQEKFGPEHDMARQLSQYYLEAEEYEKALGQLELVESFERDNLNVKIQIALIMIEQKKYEPAANRLEDVLQQAPESDKVRYYLGAVYEEIKRTDLSLMHFKKVPPMSSYFAEAVVHSAQMLKNSGNTEEALALTAKSIEARDDLPQLYAYYATLLDEKKSYKKALTMLTAAVEKFPTNTQLQFFLGTMYDRTGETTKSIEQMNKVIQIDKDHVQALNYLAYTYAELGHNLDEAIELAGRALQLQPNDGYILDTIGWIHFKKGDNEQAIKYLEAAHRAKSDESIIAEHLGDAYLRYQMWQKAQLLYRRAADLERDSAHNKKIMEKLANVRAQSQQPTRVPASQSKPRTE